MIRFERFSLIFLLVATTFSNCMSTKHHEVQQNSTNANNFGCKKLGDLNSDVLSIIVDNLNIDDMLSLLEVYPIDKFHDVARFSYWTRYKEYTVAIDHQLGVIRIQNEHENLPMLSIEYATQILENFGGLFHQLRLTDPSNETMQYVYKYAKESITKLSIIGSTPDVLEFFTQPFEMTEELDFYYSFGLEPIKLGPLPLNQMFPNIRQLAANFGQFVNLDFMLYEFPLVEHFEFDHLDPKKEDTDISAFLELNPQIRTIEVPRISQMLCDTINTHLTNLENLAILRFNFKMEHETSIASVKHFELSTRTFLYSFTATMTNLSLPNLESFSTNLNQIPIVRNLYEFLAKHNHISRLDIRNVLCERIIPLMNNLPNLTNVILHHMELDGMSSNEKFSIQTISKIIRTQQRLEKLELIGFYFDQNELDNLRERFGIGWNIAAVHLDDSNKVNLMFEKKE